MEYLLHFSVLEKAITNLHNTVGTPLAVQSSSSRIYCYFHVLAYQYISELAQSGCLWLGSHVYCLCYVYVFMPTICLKYNKVPQPCLKHAGSMTKN